MLSEGREMELRFLDDFKEYKNRRLRQNELKYNQFTQQTERNTYRKYALTKCASMGYFRNWRLWIRETTSKCPLSQVAVFFLPLVA